MLLQINPVILLVGTSSLTELSNFAPLYTLNTRLCSSLF